MNTKHTQRVINGTNTQGRRQRGGGGEEVRGMHPPHLTRWGDGMYNHPPRFGGGMIFAYLISHNDDKNSNNNNDNNYNIDNNNNDNYDDDNNNPHHYCNCVYCY